MIYLSDSRIFVQKYQFIEARELIETVIFSRYTLSLKIMPFDRSYTTSCWSAIVSIALYLSTVFELLFE